MLAFNLGIFFRNLKGEDVLFSAQAEHAAIHFTGSVLELRTHADLDRRLDVTLTKDGLFLHMGFEEDEEAEDPESMEVEVSLTRQGAKGLETLARTTFRFGDISLKPLDESAGGDEGPTVA